MTVTGLFNVAGTLLFGNVDLGGPEGLFYFYSYFIIFVILGAYFWPLFVSHTLAHQFRARLYGVTYSGLVLATVFLSSIFNEQSRAFALLLNAPYMLCASLVFLYFLHTFMLYEGNGRRRPARRRDSIVVLPRVSLAIRERAREIEFQVQESEKMLSWERAYLRRLLAGEGRDMDAEDAAEARQLAEEQREVEAAEAAEETGFDRVRGPTRRFLAHAGAAIGWALRSAANRLLFGAGFEGARLSTRLLCGILMQLMISYNSAVFLCFQFAALIEPYLGGNWDDELEALFIIGSIAAASLTFAIIFVQSLVTLRRFRGHMARLRRGDYGFVPGGKLNRYDLNDTVGYMGFQVGYGLVGYFYLFLIIMLLALFIWSIVTIPSVRDFVLQQLLKEWLFIPLLSVMLFIQVQRVTMRWLFLNQKDGDETGSSDGRFYTRKFQGFSHYEYFMTFVNTMRGMISFLFSRLLYPFGFTLLFCTRLDICLVVQGVEFMDEGHSAYLGMALADHRHNNPVLLMFIHFLSVAVERKAIMDAIAQEAVVALLPSAPINMPLAHSATRKDAASARTGRRAPTGGDRADLAVPLLAPENSSAMAINDDEEPGERAQLLAQRTAGRTFAPLAGSSATLPVGSYLATTAEDDAPIWEEGVALPGLPPPATETPAPPLGADGVPGAPGIAGGRIVIVPADAVPAVPMVSTEPALDAGVPMAAIVVPAENLRGGGDGHRRRLLRNRWWLAVTLNNNITIRRYRASRLSALRAKDADTDTASTL